MLDATKSLEQRRLLEIELDAVGIRLNKSKPDGSYTLKLADGTEINRILHSCLQTKGCWRGTSPIWP